ncbi:hypothetical protein FACS1894195_1150 [Bacteroidia bacterium]|nr:hypothetical protein FACS1894195_1150 [Bacteroidia bacterium]
MMSCSKDNDNDNPEDDSKGIVETSPMVKDIKRLPTSTSSSLQVIASYAGMSELSPLLTADVEKWRVVYRMEYPAGSATDVSGVLLKPSMVNEDFPTLVYMHATEGNRDNAPSEQGSLEVTLGTCIASAFKCNVLVPDYVGYGESKSLAHPYVHGESLAQTGLDFLLAIENYEESPVSFPGTPHPVLIAGYSEGGYAALALHRKIEQTPQSGFTVAKTIAGSGPYDLVAFSKAVVQQNTDIGSTTMGSFLWVLHTYKNDMAFKQPYSEIFTPDNDAKLKAINYDFSYYKSKETSISTTPSQLFATSFVNSVVDGTATEFLSVSAQNSLNDFAPADSVIFVYGDADTWVYPLNTTNTFTAMQGKGCKVKVHCMPGGTHETTLTLFRDVVISSLLAQ